MCASYNMSSGNEDAYSGSFTFQAALPTEHLGLVELTRKAAVVPTEDRSQRSPCLCRWECSGLDTQEQQVSTLNVCQVHTASSLLRGQLCKFNGTNQLFKPLEKPGAPWQLGRTDSFWKSSAKEGGRGVQVDAAEKDTRSSEGQKSRREEIQGPGQVGEATGPFDSLLCICLGAPVRPGSLPSSQEGWVLRLPAGSAIQAVAHTSWEIAKR